MRNSVEIIYRTVECCTYIMDNWNVYPNLYPSSLSFNLVGKLTDPESQRKSGNESCSLLEVCSQKVEKPAEQ